MRGGIRVSPHQIFGPSNNGGNSDLIHQSQLFQTGEGIGDIFSSLYRRFKPLAQNAAKRLINSKTARQGGQKLLDIAKNIAKDVAVDALEGDKSIKESLNENLTSARKSIADSIRKANKRDLPRDEVVSPKKPVKRAKFSTAKKRQNRVKHYSIFEKQ